MTDRRDAFEYDVAVSFAKADRAIAEELADLLQERSFKVYLDEYKSHDAWGRDVVDHLTNLYARKARYCILLISKQYPLKAWTEAERTSARERALRDAEEYIVPIQLDDVEVPGIAELKAFQELHQQPMESIVFWLEEKLNDAKSHSRPPSKSHDLRSGNVPSDEKT